MSGIGSTIVQGMAFGTGSAIAHRAVGAAASALGGGGDEEAPEDSVAGAAPAGAAPAAGGARYGEEEDPCRRQTVHFRMCLDEEGSTFSQCQELFEMMKSCQAEAKLQREYSSGSGYY